MKRSAQKIRIALSIAQKGNSRMRLNKTLQGFADEGVGQIIGREYIVDHAARQAIRQWLTNQGVDWRSPSQTLFEGSREDVAARNINEKNATLNANQGRIHVSVIGSCVKVNGQTMHALPLADSFISIIPEAITELSADYLLLIENHRAFTRIRDFVFHEDLTGTLAVYRGDPDTPHGETWARRLAGCFNIRLITFADFDAAGLSIGLGARSDALLLPEITTVRTLRGSSEDYQVQFDQWVRVQHDPRLAEEVAPWLQLYKDKKEGVTQERMLAFGVPLRLVHLPSSSTEDHGR